MPFTRADLPTVAQAVRGFLRVLETVSRAPDPLFALDRARSALEAALPDPEDVAKSALDLDQQAALEELAAFVASTTLYEVLPADVEISGPRLCVPHAHAQTARWLEGVLARLEGRLAQAGAPAPTSAPARPGRPTEHDPAADAAFAEAWGRARSAGVDFKCFCSERGIRPSEGRRILDRDRWRRRSSSE